MTDLPEENVTVRRIIARDELARRANEPNINMERFLAELKYESRFSGIQSFYFGRASDIPHKIEAISLPNIKLIESYAIVTKPNGFEPFYGLFGETVGKRDFDDLETVIIYSTPNELDFIRKIKRGLEEIRLKIAEKLATFYQIHIELSICSSLCNRTKILEKVFSLIFGKDNVKFNHPNESFTVTFNCFNTIPLNPYCKSNYTRYLNAGLARTKFDLISEDDIPTSVDLHTFSTFCEFPGSFLLNTGTTNQTSFKTTYSHKLLEFFKVILYGLGYYSNEPFNSTNTRKFIEFLPKPEEFTDAFTLGIDLGMNNEDYFIFLTNMIIEHFHEYNPIQLYEMIVAIMKELPQTLLEVHRELRRLFKLLSQIYRYHSPQNGVSQHGRSPVARIEGVSCPHPESPSVSSVSQSMGSSVNPEISNREILSPQPESSSNGTEDQQPELPWYYLIKMPIRITELRYEGILDENGNKHYDHFYYRIYLDDIVRMTDEDQELIFFFIRDYNREKTYEWGYYIGENEEFKEFSFPYTDEFMSIIVSKYLTPLPAPYSSPQNNESSHSRPGGFEPISRVNHFTKADLRGSIDERTIVYYSDSRKIRNTTEVQKMYRDVKLYLKADPNQRIMNKGASWNPVRWFRNLDFEISWSEPWVEEVGERLKTLMIEN